MRGAGRGRKEEEGKEKGKRGGRGMKQAGEPSECVQRGKKSRSGGSKKKIGPETDGKQT